MNSKKIATTALLSLFMLTGCGGDPDILHASISNICERLVTDPTHIAISKTADGEVGYFIKHSEPGNDAEKAKFVNYEPDFKKLIAGENGYYDVTYRALDGLKIVAKYNQYNDNDNKSYIPSSETSTLLYNVSLSDVATASAGYDFAIKAIVSKYEYTSQGTITKNGFVGTGTIIIDGKYTDTTKAGATFIYGDTVDPISLEYKEAEESFVKSIYSDVADFGSDTVMGYTRAKPDNNIGQGSNTSDYFFGHTFFESGTQLRETELGRYPTNTANGVFTKALSDARPQLFVHTTSFFTDGENTLKDANKIFEDPKTYDSKSNLHTSSVINNIATKIHDGLKTKNELAYTTTYDLEEYFDIDAKKCKDSAGNFSLSSFLAYYNDKDDKNKKVKPTVIYTEPNPATGTSSSSVAA